MEITYTPSPTYLTTNKKFQRRPEWGVPSWGVPWGTLWGILGYPEREDSDTEPPPGGLPRGIPK